MPSWKKIVTEDYVDSNVYDIKNFGFNFGSPALTKVYVPLNGGSSDYTSNVGRNEFHTFVAPYDGYLSKIMMRTSVWSGITELGFHKASDGTAEPSTTASASVTVTMSTADITYAFAFGSASAPFSKGDIINISFKPYRNPADVNGTAVFIYDITT
tara:strand:- start:400 stop:867 length:468 start_codon:yes stop_codon:yes gene_type:complete